MLDRNMNFHTRIKNICRKVDQKLSPLSKISPYLDQRKKVLLYKSIIKVSLITVRYFGCFPQGNH